MKPPRLSRRKFFASILLAAGSVACTDAACFEPTWLEVRQIRIGQGPPSHKLVHFIDRYDMGLYQTAAGPLYVNPGIGYIGHCDFRFNCRPEVTVIEI